MDIDMAEFIGMLGEVLEVEASELGPTTRLADLPSWDSVAVVSFIAAVDDRYGVRVRGAGLQSAQSIDDLVALVRARTAEGT